MMPSVQVKLDTQKTVDRMVTETVLFLGRTRNGDQYTGALVGFHKKVRRDAVLRSGYEKAVSLSLQGVTTQLLVLNNIPRRRWR